MDCLREPLPATFRLNDNGPFTDVLRRRLETEFDFGVLEVEGKQVQPPKRLAWYVERREETGREGKRREEKRREEKREGQHAAFYYMYYSPSSSPSSPSSSPSLLLTLLLHLLLLPLLPLLLPLLLSFFLSFFLKRYPGGNGWQLGCGRSFLKKCPELKRCHRFMVDETESGNMSRQEAVSMIPPFLLDVKVHGLYEI